MTGGLVADDKVVPLKGRLRGAKAAPDLAAGPGGDDPAPVLPPDCPVTPLGHQSMTMWFLDHANQLIALKPDCRKGEVMLLFGGGKYLESVVKWRAWRAPKTAIGEKGPQPNGFDQKKVQEDLIEAASGAGVFNPQGMLFGRGAHRRPIDEALVLHAGDTVLIAGEVDPKTRTPMLDERRPGRIEGKIYPALPALPPPAAAASPPEEAQRLQITFKHWYFQEQQAAPLLLLGWVAQAMLGGAVPWRAHVWLTGETAAGKSTLQKLIRAILDAWGLYTEDASEAAVRQMLKDDTLPVLIDEAEADDKAERQRAMLNLARKASSGAKMHRGGADHNASEFTAHSAFLFSSILHSPLDPQDRNRFAILSMRQVPAGATEPPLDLKYWREAGRRFHRRMIDQWPRFDRTLADYKDEIAAQGFQGRWRDTFGVLLACADMLLYSAAPSTESEANEGWGRQVEWVRLCLPLMQRGRLEAEDTTTRCIAHLTSSLLPAAAGKHPETVGRWLRRAMEFDDAGNFFGDARAKIASHGLRVVNLRKTAKGNTGAVDAALNAPVFVLVAGQTNTAMRGLFQHSKWADGGWMQALEAAVWKGEDDAAPEAEWRGARKVEARMTAKKEHVLAVPIECLIGPIGTVEG